MADRLETSIGNNRGAESTKQGLGAEISAFRPVKGARESGAATQTKAALSRALAGIR
jgi:hypothetical protein